jgi:cytochrome c5
VRWSIGIAAGLWVGATIGARAAAAEPADEVREVREVREQAREVLSARCGKCHDGDRAGAPPAALAVFDLREAAFAARMSSAQLGKVLRRLDGMGAPAEERERVARFVSLERRARGARER